MGNQLYRQRRGALPTFYGRLPEERDRDNSRVESALFGELVPNRARIDRSIHAKVAGVTYRNENGRERQDLIAAILQFDLVVLDRDPEQEHDSNTVRVMAMIEGELTHIGNLPRDVAVEVAPDIDSGRFWNAIVTRVGGFPTKGVSLMLYRTRA